MYLVLGGWELFQELLTTLKNIAEKHQVSIANIAICHILDQHSVGGVIVGARLGMAKYLDLSLTMTIGMQLMLYLANIS